jgi:hypothetical protein
MADAVGYWSLPSMDPSAAVSWLSSNPSDRMIVTSSSRDEAAEGTASGGGLVVDQTNLGSLEALIFTVTSTGTGTGIRADAFRKAGDSVCATASPGDSLGIGG